MAERPEDHRYSRPIVPDPEASLTVPRQPVSRAPSVWPSWLLAGLVVALAALAWLGWEERQRFQREIARLSGEMSNVHARFDAEEGRGEALVDLRERLTSLEEAQQARDTRLTEALSANEQRASALAEVRQALAEVEARLSRLAEQAESRDATLVAVRDSLDALERAGEEGRGTLQSSLNGLEETLSDTRSRLTAVERQQADRLDAFDARLAELASDVEALTSSRQDEASRREALVERLAAMESELRQLRQAQLALSAQLEVLRQ
ncbi:hypothetical protein [Halomonas cerina]|uniref:Chromosome segregation ATPase n=1 Tax=Halomonas cerina TaxID=447424 RepID=A0A839V8T4_9GAMM|nr:hypothetical protein [Halomonas cerina]MBB3189137.1 chromosome segregation ATPase [Halomonas cerina]